MTQWIDTHVHIFTEATAGETPVMINGGINDVPAYVKGLEGNRPSGTVIVDFSKAVTSDHVMETLGELETAGIPAQGIIRGNISDERTFDWIKHPQVAGIRLYGKSEIPDFTQDKAKWDQLFALVRQYQKHICLFGDPKLIRELVAQLPNDLALLLDHLGMPNAHEGENQHDYAQLLADLSSRFKAGQAVYFKGPGYRTSFEPNKTVPFMVKIIETFGESQLLLGASDAPFAGPVVEQGGKFSGKKNQEVVGYDSILDYLNSLIELTAERTNKSFEMLQMQLLYSNAQKLYQFEEAKSKVA
jgi:predicted TIM-barrel fold metal-dependent hydrolase